jgi:hypothetical protein
MFKIFEIREGKFTAFPQLSPKKLKGFFIISAVMVVISLLSGWLNISEKQLWKYYQVLIEQLNLKYELPELKNNQDKLDARAELAVDMAIQRYEEWERSLPPRMTNKTILKEMENPKYSDPQRLTVKDAIYYECPGDIMGIRGAWVDKDPNCQ